MARLAIYKDSNINSTAISNRFIDEYMPDANAAQVKVYLFLTRMLGAGQATSVSDMADKFNYPEKDIIRALKGRITIILTTHYMEEAEALSDRIAIMKDGKLLVCDTAEKIKEMTDTDSFEQAFVRIVKGEKR